MADAQERRILAVVNDLFFASKISAASKRVGIPVEMANNEEKLLRETLGDPCIVILDLNDAVARPIELITKLKAASPERPQRPERDVQIIGYLSHVQGELNREATKAGCDLVLPRSVFSQNLDDLLRQRSCHL